MHTAEELLSNLIRLKPSSPKAPVAKKANVNNRLFMIDVRREKENLLKFQVFLENL
jgi:hypothetical protein